MGHGLRAVPWLYFPLSPCSLSSFPLCIAQWPAMCLSWPVVSASLFLPLLFFLFMPMHQVCIRHCPEQQHAHAAACHCLPLPVGKGYNQVESSGKQRKQRKQTEAKGKQTIRSKGKLLYLFGTLYACLTYWIFWSLCRCYCLHSAALYIHFTTLYFFFFFFYKLL
jgi:hypothetical protein